MLKIHLTRNDIKKYNTSPLGLVVPEFIGQYWITDDNKVYFAKGLTSLDWIEASGNNDALSGENIKVLDDPDSITIKEAIEYVVEEVGDCTFVDGIQSENLTDAINEVFQFGVSAKERVVEAINSKSTVSDVSTTDSWETIAGRIGDIKEDQGGMKIIGASCSVGKPSSGSVSISADIGFTPKIVFVHVRINHSYGYVKCWISSIGGDLDSAFGYDFDNYCTISNMSSTGFTLSISGREVSSFEVDKWFAVDTDITFSNSGSGKTCCFDPDSQVLMADGSTKNIENIEKGDMVISLNEDTNEFEIQKVERTIIKHNSDDLVYINLSNGDKIGMRAYHPLLTVDGWKSLRPNQVETIMDVGTVPLLKVGDILIGYDENVSIVSIEARPDINNYDTYNLSVEGHHNYIVNGIVAHNAVCPMSSK